MSCFLRDSIFLTFALLDILGQELSGVVQYITCMLSESGLLWIGTSAGFILTMCLPRLEGVPQVRGRPSVSYHAQSGAVHFLAAVQCNMVPVSSDVTEESTSLSGDGVALTDTELLGPLQKQPSWVSSADLSFVHDLELSEHYGSVSDLYGSLLKGIDVDFDSELTNSDVILRRHNDAMHLSTVNTVSNRVINRLSNVISKSRQARPQPLANEGQQLSRDANQNMICPVTGSCEESVSSPSVLESLSVNSANELTAAFERSAASASYRRLVVPACPSMVTSNLVHVLSSKALIVVSGGTGYKCWNQNHNLPSVDDRCLLMYKC